MLLASTRWIVPLLLLSWSWNLAVGAEPAQAQVKNQPKPPNRPNILVVLADDLGYGDLGCYGHPVIKSPNLDRFAREGMRLTDCYSAAPNCSPARAGLMTGRTPTRVGIYNWIPTFCPMHLRKSEVTIANLLHGAGYQTCQAGKWHLSGALNDQAQPQPGEHGFDHWFATQNNALPSHRDPVNFFRNGKAVGPMQGFSAQLVAEEATRWLEEGWSKESPFFLFVCFHEPHEPIATDPRFARIYENAQPDQPPSLAPHHGNVTQLDAGFGKLLNALDALKVRDNTLIWFTSDNGPAITGIHPHGSAGPLRDKKGYVYDGGIRVPGMIQWPGVVKPGSVSAAPIGGVDLLPTLCAVAGIDPPKDRVIDGVNVLPVLRGAKDWRRQRPLFWHFHRARGDIRVALRQGEWKIAAELTTPTPKPSGGIEEGETEAIKQADLKDFRLYNLSRDIAEQRDVQKKHPETFHELRALLVKTHKSVQQEQPIWPAWEWPRYESQHIRWPDYRKQPRKR